MTPHTVAPQICGVHHAGMFAHAVFDDIPGWKVKPIACKQGEMDIICASTHRAQQVSPGPLRHHKFTFDDVDDPAEELGRMSAWTRDYSPWSNETPCNS